MWLYLIAIVLLVLGLVGGVLTGGIFLIIFIPLGAIMLATAVITGAFARSAERRAGSTGRSSSEPSPLPHSFAEPTHEVPTSADALVDARRREQ